MLEGQVPRLNSLDGGAKVTSIWHIRRGRECKIPCITRHIPRNIQALKNATLPVRGQQQQLFNTLPRDIRNMTDCKVDLREASISIYPPSQTNHRSWAIQLSEELTKTAFFTWESLQMPTGHRKWKCLAKQIRLAEEVALTALPGYSDARRYYKVTR